MKNTTKSVAWPEALVTIIANAAQNAPDGKLTNDDVKALAKNDAMLKAGKTVAMIRGKANSEGVYKAQDPSAKPAGETPTRKIELVSALETLIGVPKNSLATFEKASKLELQKAVDKLVKASDQQNADS